jgi:hypothetical protein
MSIYFGKRGSHRLGTRVWHASSWLASGFALALPHTAMAGPSVAQGPSVATAPPPISSAENSPVAGSPSPSVSPLEQATGEIIDVAPRNAASSGSLRELREAQTQYYRESAKTITEANTFGGWVKENAVVVGSLIAALIAFVSALLSLQQNSKTAAANLKLSLDNSEAGRRSQQDTQFYEALKRLGDKDSPALRASAVALIAQLARRNPSRSAGYLEVAVDQLATALRIERDPVVIEAIPEAVRYLSGVAAENVVAAQEMIERLYRANRAQQAQLSMTMLKYLLLSGAKPENAIWPELVFEEIAARTGYRVDVIKGLLPPENTLNVLTQAESTAMAVLDETKRSEQRTGLANGVFILGQQLHASSRAILACLTALTPFATFGNLSRGTISPSVAGAMTEGGPVSEIRQELPGIFLAQMDLKGVNFKGANLSGARLQYTNLFGANLENANLAGTLLDGASMPFTITNAYLNGVSLLNTHLGQVDLTEVDLEGANWWDADFDYVGQEGPSFNRTALDILFEKYGSGLSRAIRRRGSVESLSGVYIRRRLQQLSGEKPT